MFDDSFLDGLPNDPVEAAHMMCSQFLQFHEIVVMDNEVENYDSYIEGYAAIEALIEA